MRVKGSVYTISIREISNLPDDCLTLLVARKKMENMNGIIWCLELAPSKRLFWDIKKDIISWNQFESRYLEELKNNQFTLNKINHFINKGINVALVCYCNDFNFCHRKLIGQELEKLGINVNYR